jgi:hypothetical protein
MKQSDIFVLLLVIVGLGLSFYRRYSKNKKGPGNTASTSGSVFSSHPKDDDYEPYSKK